MIFKLGELFCGPGGIAWGATHADIGNSDYKIIHQWANDYDASTCETYRHNICRNEPQTVYHEDIRKFDMSKLARDGWCIWATVFLWRKRVENVQAAMVSRRKCWWIKKCK